MTLLELAEQSGVKFHRCNAKDWGGTWGWSETSSCKFNGSRSKNAACISWAKSTFGVPGYKLIRSQMNENARLKARVGE